MNFSETTLEIKEIKEVKSNDFAEFDILLGGFPCQVFSIAEYRQRFDDEKGRGDLFFEVEKFYISSAKRGYIGKPDSYYKPDKNTYDLYKYAWELYLGEKSQKAIFKWLKEEGINANSDVIEKQLRNDYEILLSKIKIMKVLLKKLGGKSSEYDYQMDFDFRDYEDFLNFFKKVIKQELRELFHTFDTIKNLHGVEDGTRTHNPWCHKPVL